MGKYENHNDLILWWVRSHIFMTFWKIRIHYFYAIRSTFFGFSIELEKPNNEKLLTLFSPQYNLKQNKTNNSQLWIIESGFVPLMAYLDMY